MSRRAQAGSRYGDDMPKRSHPEPDQQPQLLTTEQVAARLAVDPSTVRRWVVDGRLPASRPGRGYRIDPRDVDELLTISRPLVTRTTSSTTTARQSRGLS